MISLPVDPHIRLWHETGSAVSRIEPFQILLERPLGRSLAADGFIVAVGERFIIAASANLVRPTNRKSAGRRLTPTS